MGWRRSGSFQAPQEILVMTCDVCERDIGHEDGRRPKTHFEISRLPNAGGIDDQQPPASICSPECLRAYAASADDPSAPRRKGGAEPPPPRSGNQGT